MFVLLQKPATEDIHRLGSRRLMLPNVGMSSNPTSPTGSELETNHMWE